jgi:hypothetical protein
MSFTMRALPVCPALARVAAGASAASDSGIGGVVQKHFTGATGTVVGNVAKDIYYRDDVYSAEIKNKNTVKPTTPTAALTIRGAGFEVFVATDGSTPQKNSPPSGERTGPGN